MRTKPVPIRSLPKSQVSANSRVELRLVPRSSAIFIKKKAAARHKAIILAHHECFVSWWFSCLCAGALGLPHTSYAASGAPNPRWPVAHVSGTLLLTAFVRWMRVHRAQQLAELEEALTPNAVRIAVESMLPGPVPSMLGRVRIPPLKMARAFFSQEVSQKPVTWPGQK